MRARQPSLTISTSTDCIRLRAPARQRRLCHLCRLRHLCVLPRPAYLAMSSLSSPADLSARLDELTVEFFTIFAAIRSVRSQLSSSMADGFYELSLARHESPLLPLDQSSYAGRDMTATTTITHNARQPASSGTATEPTVFSLNQQPAPSSFSSPIRPAVFTAHLSARERKLDALIAQRGQLNDTIERRIDQSVAASAITASSPPSLPQLPSAPLHWFGLLTPPALRTAQLAFSQAMQPVARLAALHDKLRTVEERWMSALQQKDAAMADARKKAADRWKANSERSEEKKADDDEDRGSGLSGLLRKELEESKEARRSRPSGSSTRELHALVDGADVDEVVGDAMQSLTITKHRKKDS